MEESAVKPQPVALEVSVTVNGARSVEGSDKREPFSETTKTVLIFSSGAVIRLASFVAPGQLLFLTNENTKQEVVCQVVKSKNYRNVSGYVELEFTEPAMGFWGLRFPGERASGVPRAISNEPGAAAVPKDLPGVPQIQRSGVTTPAPQYPAGFAGKNAPPVSATEKIEALQAAPASPSLLAPAAKAGTPISPVTDFPKASESKPATFLEEPQAKQKPARLSSDPDTEALRQETARLQEQLSTLLFSESKSKSGVEAPSSVPRVHAQALPDAAPTPIETARRDKKPATAAIPEPRQKETSSVRPVVPAPQKSKLDLAAEEVKIPAWLEPLARNAPVAPEHVAPAESETTPIADEHEAASVPEFSSEGPAPTFGTQLLLDGKADVAEAEARRSGKGLLAAALAAGVILAGAGGVWYFEFHHPATTRAQTASPTFATLPTSTQEAGSVSPPSAENRALSATPESTTGAATPTVLATSAAGNAQPLAVNSRGLLKDNSAKNPGVPAKKPEVVAEPPRKSALGQVHLARPTVGTPRRGANEDVAAPGLNLGSAQPTGADSMAPDFIAGRGNQPAAPLPVGGEVKPARLLHSVAPAYPPLARSQRVSGDVILDAYIDASGHVTSMKVISGPVLLHQAAKDALRQWRYQPAMLDDKPVPMHLTVTVQFRLN